MLLAFVRRGRWTAVYLALCLGVFASLFALYRLPWEAVGYGLLLCLSLGAAIFLWRFALFVRRVRQVEQAAPQQPGQPMAPLPAPRDRLETAYRALAHTQQHHLAQLAQGQSRQWRQAQDYYTLWAHQIKTPLAAMSLLLSAPEPDVGALAAQLVRVELYADMALQYQRLEGDGSDLVLGHYDVEDIVRGAVRRFSRLFIQKKIRLELSPLSFHALTDEKWLSFLVEQLLSNALKYTPEGGVIRIFRQGDSLVVEDTGIGIRPEDLPRVTERSFTGYNGRQEHKSTGLGLYLCRQVADMLGHGLSLTSQVGEGTRVALDLSSRPILPC